MWGGIGQQIWETLPGRLFLTTPAFSESGVLARRQQLVADELKLEPSKYGILQEAG